MPTQGPEDDFVGGLIAGLVIIVVFGIGFKLIL